MEQRKEIFAGRELLRNVLQVILATAILYVLGGLIGSIFIYREIIPIVYGEALCVVLGAAAAFGGTAAAVLLARRKIFLTGLLAQGILLGILAAIGLAFGAGEINWIRAAVMAIAAMGGVLAASLLPSGRKKKKFQKNVERRLKKR